MRTQRPPTIPDDGPNALDANRPTQERSALWLIGLAPAPEAPRFPVDGPVLIGRGPYNHVVLEDTHISWQHARVVPHDGALLLHDLNSTNGTTVNGVRATKQRLEPNDVVCFGRFVFRVE